MPEKRHTKNVDLTIPKESWHATIAEKWDAKYKQIKCVYSTVQYTRKNILYHTVASLNLSFNPTRSPPTTFWLLKFSSPHRPQSAWIIIGTVSSHPWCIELAKNWIFGCWMHYKFPVKLPDFWVNSFRWIGFRNLGLDLGRTSLIQQSNWKIAVGQ